MPVVMVAVRTVSSADSDDHRGNNSKSTGNNKGDGKVNSNDGDGMKIIILWNLYNNTVSIDLNLKFELNIPS